MPRKSKAYRALLAARRCWGRGKPKRAYDSEAEANAACRDGQKPYACKQHGWHVGGVISRDLRIAMGKF
jgi:hypothetical protein